VSVLGGRIGVFGSLFDPPHVGHLLLCAEAVDQLALDRVLLVPTGSPPHRPGAVEPADVRLRLVGAAARTDPSVFVSRVEIDRRGPSYMVDTLRELRRQYPGRELVLLLGADQLARLGTWHEAEAIPRLARVAVAPRPGVTLRGLDGARVERIEMPLVDVSSTLLRARIAAGRSIRHLVPEPVRALIESEGLYRRAPTAPGAPEPRPAGMLAWEDDFPPVEEQH
jgi:nicotinate-nucleotide adenylyltransferase